MKIKLNSYCILSLYLLFAPLTGTAGVFGKLGFSLQMVLSIFAGNPYGPGLRNGVLANSAFNEPAGIAIDSSGNIFVADSKNNIIRKINTSGVVSVFAGSGDFGYVNGTGVAASFSNPKGLAIDSVNNIYVADSFNYAIRKITPAGVVTTLAGGNYGTLDATGTAAGFSNPTSLAIDNTNSCLYVTDTDASTIRKVTFAGVVTTYAGAANTTGRTNGTTSAASFKNPEGIVYDGVGNLFIADTGNHEIRRIIVTSSSVSLFAGSSTGAPGNTDGTSTAARFNAPIGIVVDVSGHLFVSERVNQTIRKIVISTQSTSTYTGTSGSSGSIDGTGLAAKFYSPSYMAVSASNDLYVSDSLNSTIRKINSSAIVQTIGGKAGNSGFANGTGAAISFNLPEGLTIDSSGNVFVADTANNIIRKITPNGTSSTIAGSATGLFGNQDGTGSGALFFTPKGIALGLLGELYVADSGNQTIRKVDVLTGQVTTFAGTASSFGANNSTLNLSTFYSPTGIALDSYGNIFVTDKNNNCIRKIDPIANTVSTFAGVAGSPASIDGTGSSARFYSPDGMVIDKATNTIYVSDSSSHLIRKITPGGVVTTLAGMDSQAGSLDGLGANARFKNPKGLSLDVVGNLYVADFGNSLIRKISTLGFVTTVLGQAGQNGSSMGSVFSSETTVNSPSGLVFFPSKLFITSSNGILTIPTR